MKLLHYGNNIAEPQRDGDCGYDIRSAETKYLRPMEVYTFHVETYIAIPEGHFGMVGERSSMGAMGIAVRGGIFDSSYRGECGVILQNLSNEYVKIEEGDRIAQMIFIPYARFDIQEVNSIEELGETERNQNGFGSTGK